MAASSHVKIIVRVRRDRVRALDSEVSAAKARRPGKKITRALVVEEMLERRLDVQSMPDGPPLHKALLAESATMRGAAAAARDVGDAGAARRAGLIAAALELKALAALEQPTEDAIRSSLVTAMCLLKDAVGYTYLPEVPGSRRAKT